MVWKAILLLCEWDTEEAKKNAAKYRHEHETKFFFHEANLKKHVEQTKHGHVTKLLEFLLAKQLWRGTRDSRPGEQQIIQTFTLFTNWRARTSELTEGEWGGVV